MPLVEDETGGLVLHEVDLAINKVLTLAGRDEARDFVDIYHRSSGTGAGGSRPLAVVSPKGREDVGVDDDFDADRTASIASAMSDSRSPACRASSRAFATISSNSRIEGALFTLSTRPRLEVS